jgi:hypothetical protein
MEMSKENSYLGNVLIGNSKIKCIQEKNIICWNISILTFKFGALHMPRLALCLYDLIRYWCTLYSHIFLAQLL